MSAPEKGDARVAVAAATGHLVRTSAQTKVGPEVYRAADSRTAVANRIKAAERAAASTPPLVTTTQEKKDFLTLLRNRFVGHSSATQGDKFLAALRHFDVTTQEARTLLDIMSPAVVVHQLIHGRGELIAMTMVSQVGVPGGKPHRTGCYSLMHEGEGAP